MAPLLRMRNQFVVTAHTGGGERRHALALYVHIREQDVAYFNSSSDGDGESEGESVNYIEHALELMDSDADFEALVRDLDGVRPACDNAAKSSKSAAAPKSAASALVQLQWRAVAEPTHRGVANVLATTRKPRSECFSPIEKKKKGATGNQKEEESEEVYGGGMFTPLPLRRVAVEMWLYPPQVVLPSTGDHLPTDDRSVTDFFHDDNRAA